MSPRAPAPSRLDDLLAAAAFVLAGLVAIASAAGVWAPGIYDRETASWTAQGQAQDLFDLVVVAPLLVLCGIGVRRGAHLALLGFGGVAVYTLYSFVLYAFGMHFNALFLVYCATLGVSFFALLGLWQRLAGEDGRTWFGPGAPVRPLGWLLVAQAAAFAALWLATIVPALVRGETPAELAEVGLATNPVWVLDLSIVLPGIAIAGVRVLRRRGSGYLLAPIMTGFAVLMSLAIAAMMIEMRRRGLAPDASVAVVMFAVAAASAAVLAWFLRHARRADGAAPARRRPMAPAGAAS